MKRAQAAIVNVFLTPHGQTLCTQTDNHPSQVVVPTNQEQDPPMDISIPDHQNWMKWLK